MKTKCNNKYINLARSKSEALLYIYILFEQNIKSCNAKRRRQRKRTKNEYSFLGTFLCRRFARLQHETSRNVLVTRFMEEMSFVFLFTTADFHHCGH